MDDATWFPDGGKLATESSAIVPGPFELIVAAWQNGAANLPAGPYGLATLDLSSQHRVLRRRLSPQDQL